MGWSEIVLLYSILVAAAASVFLLIWSLNRIHSEVTEATRLDDDRRGKITSPIFRIFVAFARPLGVLVRFYTLRAEQRYEQSGRRPMLISIRERVARNLSAAGSPHAITPEEYLGLVALWSLIGLAVGGMAMTSTGWTLLLPVAFICGTLWPISWLNTQVRKRKTQIFRALPFALDLLTLSVEAGLDFTSALARIVSKISGTPLGHEFNELLRQIQMGHPRAEALRQLGRRVDLEEMSNFTGALIQADELGASIGPILRIQAERMRTRREQIAEKRAMEAPVKILFPLILFIFPTVFLIILGPVALFLLQKYGWLP